GGPLDAAGNPTDRLMLGISPDHLGDIMDAGGRFEAVRPATEDDKGIHWEAWATYEAAHAPAPQPAGGESGTGEVAASPAATPGSTAASSSSGRAERR